MQVVGKVRGKKVASAATDESQSDKRERGSNWELEELVSMARAKAELHRESQKKPALGQPFLSQEDRWTRVAEHLVKDGFCARTWTQCKNKWEGVQKEWKKFHKHIGEIGGGSPWHYDRSKRRQCGLAYIFNEELYDLVNEAYGQSEKTSPEFDADRPLAMLPGLDKAGFGAEDEEFVDESQRQADREENFVQMLYNAGTSHKAKLPTNSGRKLAPGPPKQTIECSARPSSRSSFDAAVPLLTKCDPQSALPASTTSEDQLEASTGMKRKSVQDSVVATLHQTGLAVVDALNKWEDTTGAYRCKRLELDERRFQHKERMDRERLLLEQERSRETAKQLAVMNDNLAGLVNVLTEFVKLVKPNA